MTTPLSLGARQARLTALRDFIDTGDGGVLKCYTGSTLPDNPGTATSETLLGSLTLASPSGSISVAGSLATYTLSVPRTALAAGTGVVGWVRFCKSNGDGVLDVAVVESPATGPVVFSSTQVYAGGELQLVSCVITE